VTVDPYVDPESGVLRNRLRISDAERLREVEAGLTYAALADLGTRTLPGGYDLAHLRSFHQEIFGDIYPWAGEIRVVGIARSDPFCLPHHIEAYSTEVFGGLAKERYLRGTGPSRAAQPQIGRISVAEAIGQRLAASTASAWSATSMT
jgi:cell filamentation protein